LTTAHWKVGAGFAIRYGGHRDIQWFHGDEFRRPAGGAVIPEFHPAFLALGAAQTIALVLQWWEMRKQSQLMDAHFEERRSLWVADMLTTWGADIASHGTLRLDSTRYLERDLTRLLDAIIKTPKMNIPSVLLLQIDRAAMALVDLNTLLHRELSHQINSVDGPERDGLLVPDYHPLTRFAPWSRLKGRRWGR
jgi:hypothetical protein